MSNLVVAYLNSLREQGVVFYLKDFSNVVMRPYIDKISYLDSLGVINDDDLQWLKQNKTTVIVHLLSECLNKKQLENLVNCLRKYFDKNELISDLSVNTDDLYDIINYLSNSLSERENKKDGSHFYEFFARELSFTEQPTIGNAIDLLSTWVYRWKE